METSETLLWETWSDSECGAGSQVRHLCWDGVSFSPSSGGAVLTARVAPGGLDRKVSLTLSGFY